MQTDERGTFGFVAEQQARRMAYDLAILSTDALSERHGFLYLSAEEANLAGVIAGCSQRVLVAMVHHKFDQTAPHCGFDARVVDEIVTDQLPTGKLSEVLNGWGIKVQQTTGGAHATQD